MSKFRRSKLANLSVSETFHSSLGNATTSSHRLEQLPRFAQQGPNPPSLGGRVLGEQAVLARVLVSPWRAASWRAAVHAAALFAAHRRRAARAAGSGFCAAPPTRQHRFGIAGVIAHACASLIDRSFRSQMTQFEHFAHEYGRIACSARGQHEVSVCGAPNGVIST